ncbi:MAG: GGDEF domain-containing protein [Pseudomonadota bacterium]
MPSKTIPIEKIPALRRAAVGADVIQLFSDHPSIPGLAIIDDEGRPIGYINRQAFMTKFTSLYGRALYEKRPAETLASQDYRTVSLDDDLEAVVSLERTDEQMTENTGLIVIDQNGFYHGMTSAFALMTVLLSENETLVAELRHEVAEREAVEKQMRLLAETDALTGLFNRRRFLHALSEKVERNVPLLVIYTDLDRFKQVNDNYGHAAGDTVLQAVAERLRNFHGASVCARLGGDEFALVCEDCVDEAMLDVLLRTLNHHICAPIDSHYGSLQVGASFGTARYPEEFGTVSALIEAADKRMLRAKIGPGRRQNDRRETHVDRHLKAV